MTTRLELEFNGPVVQTTFQETRSDAPKGNETEVITWESPRLTTEIPYPNRPKGSDRAICRTVNGFVNINLLNKEILTESYNNDPSNQLAKPLITVGLYGESSGMIGAIAPAQQFSLGGGFGYQKLLLCNSNGDIGSLVFNSYANLMQNIFLRVFITRGYFATPYGTPDPDPGYVLINYPVPVAFSCSGVLLASDPR